MLDPLLTREALQIEFENINALPLDFDAYQASVSVRAFGSLLENRGRDVTLQTSQLCHAGVMNWCDAYGAFWNEVNARLSTSLL